MKNKNFWIACLSGAVVTTLVSNLPILGFVNCFICAGFWGSAIFAVWLYRRLNGSITQRECVNVGLLTGLFAGILGFALSFTGAAGAQGMLNGASQFMSPEDMEGLEAIPAWAGLVFNGIGVIFNIVFGALGGWLGWRIFNPERQASKG